MLFANHVKSCIEEAQMNHGIFVLGGFLLGTLGLKAAQSAPVRKTCVRAVACGLQTKEYVANLIDETKAQCDDILADAQQLVEEEKTQASAKDITIDQALSCASEEK